MPPNPPQVVVRVAIPEDAAACGQIFYDPSLRSIGHGFPMRFPGAGGRHRRAFDDVFESRFLLRRGRGRIVGSNGLDECSSISGIGPLTIDPHVQNSGIGRKLMRAVMDRATERGAAGIRLVQAAFHNRSLSLYARLGFDVRAPLSCMQGEPCSGQCPDARCGRHNLPMSRPAAWCPGRCHGFTRTVELVEAIQQGTASLVERAGRITGYATALAFSGHATAETNLDVRRRSRRRIPLAVPEFWRRRRTVDFSAGAWRTGCASRSR